MGNDAHIDVRLERLPRSVMMVRVGEPSSFVTDNATVASVLAAYMAESNVPLGTPVFFMLDQTALPEEERYICTADWRVVVDAIKTRIVRGAPAIGIAGAAAVALRAAEFTWANVEDMNDSIGKVYRTYISDGGGFDPSMYWSALEFAAYLIAEARPTAVSLRNGCERALAMIRRDLHEGADALDISFDLFDLVCLMIEEDERINRAIGLAGAAYLKPNSRVLTYCNAGSLATAFYGTALGVVYTAVEQGKVERVFACETRPVNQGARLTIWELALAGVPTTLLCDNMQASLMAQGEVDAVIVGADRIAANGDVANKIGTYELAIVAAHNNVPFYVAAPVSTIDFSLLNGSGIPIEQRPPTEVIDEVPEGVSVYNPSFDVTPAGLVTAFITERGVYLPGELEELAVPLQTDEERFDAAAQAIQDAQGALQQVAAFMQ